MLYQYADVVTGYTGPLCEVEIDECSSSPCAHSNNCTDLVNDYLCDCLPGWAGKNCNTDIDECASNPCENNSTCHDKVMCDYNLSTVKFKLQGIGKMCMIYRMFALSELHLF